MNVVVSSDAERYLVDGIAFYSQNGDSVGQYFRNAILSYLQSLAVVGGVHEKRFGYFCMPAKRFPFAIYYSLSDDTVSVVAVLDERRNPDWIQHRLQNES